MSADEGAAREEIRELIGAYAHFGDSGRFRELCALFAPDAVLELDEDRTLRGPDAILTFLESTRTSLRADSERPLIRHHVSSIRIVIDGPDAAHGGAYFFVVTQRGPDHWGRYRDRYVRTPDGWRFAHRRVRLDGTAPGSWAAAERARRGQPS